MSMEYIFSRFKNVPDISNTKVYVFNCRNACQTVVQPVEAIKPAYVIRCQFVIAKTAV